MNLVDSHPTDILLIVVAVRVVVVRCIDRGGVGSGDGGGGDCSGNSGGEVSDRDICVTSESLLPNLIMFLSLLLTCQ